MGNPGARVLTDGKHDNSRTRELADRELADRELADARARGKGVHMLIGFYALCFMLYALGFRL